MDELKQSESKPCDVRVSLKKIFFLKLDSFFDDDVDETLDVLELVAVEVDQQHGGPSPAGSELDAGPGLLSGAHVSHPATEATHRYPRGPTSRGAAESKAPSVLVRQGLAVGEADALDGEAALLQSLRERVDQAELCGQKLLHSGLPQHLQTGGG